MSTTAGNPNSSWKISRKRTRRPSTLGPQASTPAPARTNPAAPMPTARTCGVIISAAASTGNSSIASPVGGRGREVNSTIPPAASTKAKAILVPPKSMPRVSPPARCASMRLTLPGRGAFRQAHPSPEIKVKNFRE